METDILRTNRHEVVHGRKMFTKHLIVGELRSSYIDGVDADYLFNDRLSKSINQTVTGRKVFRNVTSVKNVNIKGKINGIDVKVGFY